MQDNRELTNVERRELRSLVLEWCANYSSTRKHCLLTNRDCLMLAMTHVGSMCHYFQESVLPNNPRLEAALTYSTVTIKRCAHCGEQFVPTGRQAYCSDYCALQGRRKTDAAWRRKSRMETGGKMS